jgi:hypothetical protein
VTAPESDKRIAVLLDDLRDVCAVARPTASPLERRPRLSRLPRSHCAPPRRTKAPHGRRQRVVLPPMSRRSRHRTRPRTARPAPGHRKANHCRWSCQRQCLVLWRAHRAITGEEDRFDEDRRQSRSSPRRPSQVRSLPITVEKNAVYASIVPPSPAHPAAPSFYRRGVTARWSETGRATDLRARPT